MKNDTPGTLLVHSLPSASAINVCSLIKMIICSAPCSGSIRCSGTTQFSNQIRWICPSCLKLFIRYRSNSDGIRSQSFRQWRFAYQSTVTILTYESNTLIIGNHNCFRNAICVKGPDMKKTPIIIGGLVTVTRSQCVMAKSQRGNPSSGSQATHRMNADVHYADQARS